MPNSTMTNATVATEVAGNNGKTLVLKYKDGEKTFEVPPNVAVITLAPATEADLNPVKRSSQWQRKSSRTAATASIHRCDYLTSTSDPVNNCLW
jgi:hypothetical protein